MLADHPKTALPTKLNLGTTAFPFSALLCEPWHPHQGCLAGTMEDWENVAPIKRALSVCSCVFLSAGKPDLHTRVFVQLTWPQLLAKHVETTHRFHIPAAEHCMN